MLQLTDFVERLLKHARNGDLQLMRRPLESKFGMLLAYSDSPAALDGLADFEFVSDFAAIQNSIRSTFGYVRARHDSGQVRRRKYNALGRHALWRHQDLPGLAQSKAKQHQMAQ